MKTVPWAMMTYKQAKAADLIPQIQTHVDDLGDRAEDYCKYLNTLCGFPKFRSEW